MRKLILITTALALVGSIAAAPNRAPAKAPVKPAAVTVTAPAIPAATMPPASKGGKGIGMFVEGFGLFTLSNGTSSSQIEGDAAASSVGYKLPNSSGFGGGANIGFQILQHLGIVATFEYRSLKSREWAQTNVGATSLGLSTAQLTGFSLTAGTGNATIQNKRNIVIMGLGLRPSVEAGPGRVYAGAGVAVVLPYDDTTTVSYTGANPSATQLATGSTTKTASQNLAFGGYAELGYVFDISDNLYFGLGARMLVATTNDKDKETVTKITGANGVNTLTVTTTTTGTDSVPAANAGTVSNVTAGTSTTYTSSGVKANYASQGITDFSANVTVGFRF